MWLVAGLLLGSVVLAAVAGLHVGPHGHGLAAVLGVLAAAWLLLMVAEGRGRPLLFALLGADLVLSAALGALAYAGLTGAARTSTRRRGPEGSFGVAVTDLDPSGVVRVAGEEWSAQSVNGPVAVGRPVHVLSVEGVKLQVWGEESVEPGAAAGGSVELGFEPGAAGTGWPTAEAGGSESEAASS